MKPYFLAAVLLVTASLQSCMREYDDHREVEKVQFTFSAASVEAGRTQTSEGIKSLLLTLTKANGESVYTRHVIEILSFGDSYITQPLQLRPGHYKVTEFLLVDNSQNISHATPLKGSVLSKIVAKPLAHAFNVQKGVSNNIDMEVIETKYHKPEDFGYASFGIDVVGAFKLEVYLKNGAKNVFTDADVYIINGNDTISHQKAGPKVNRIAFKGDPEGTYKLVVSKDGYGSYTQTFVFNDLQKQLAGKSVKVFFELSFNMIANIEYEQQEFYLDITGPENLTVDWGDGTRETVQTDQTLAIYHIYDVPGKYPITVTGDLNDITEMYSVFSQAPVSLLDVSKLANLKVIWFVYTQLPAELDLSYNTKLELVNLKTPSLKSLKISAEHQINTIYIDGAVLSTTNIDSIISRIYHAAVAANRMNGEFSLYAIGDEDVDGEPDGEGMIGPPSAEALAQLRALRSNYQWNITPKDF